MEQLFKENFGGAVGDAGGADINAAMSQLMDTFKELQLQPGESAPTTREPALPAASSSSSSSTTSKPAQPKSFQETVAQTMNKLRDSSDKVEQQVAEDAKMASLTGGMSEDAMEQMMKELEGMMASGDFENVFGGLMEQLMSKELLHEPMKDLATKVRLRTCSLLAHDWL